MSNPYKPWERYNQDIFVGRQEVLNPVVQQIKQKGVPGYYVVGLQPKVGKTWLLRRLQEELSGPDCVAVYSAADESASTFDGWLNGLMREVGRQCHFTLAAGRSKITSPGASDAGLAFFEELIQTHLHQRRLILLLDDLFQHDESASALGEQIVRFLKGLLNNPITLVLAANTIPGFTIALQLRDPPPLEELSLGTFSEVEANTLIQQGQAVERLANMSEEVVRSIHSLTGRHPWLLQLLCATLYEQSAGNIKIVVEDVERASQTVLEQIVGFAPQYWLDQRQQVCAIAAAQIAPEAGHGTVSAHQIERQIARKRLSPQALFPVPAELDALVKCEVLIRPPDEENKFSFRSGLLQRLFRGATLTLPRDGEDAVSNLVQAGRQYTKEKKFAAAEKLLQLAIADNPESFEARKELGLCLFYQGKLEEALTQARSAYELNKAGGQRPLGTILLANAQAGKEANDLIAARSAVEEARRLGTLGADELLRRIAEAQGDQAEAQEALGAALKFYQEARAKKKAEKIDIRLQEEMIAQLLRERQFVQAATLLTDLITRYEEIEPDHGLRWRQENERCRRHNSFQQALRDYTEEKFEVAENLVKTILVAEQDFADEGISARHLLDAIGREQEALRLMEQGHWEDAWTIYQRLLTEVVHEFPQRRKAWQQGLVRCQEQAAIAGQFDKALEEWRQQQWTSSITRLRSILSTFPAYQRQGLAAQQLLELGQLEQKAKTARESNHWGEAGDIYRLLLARAGENLSEFRPRWEESLNQCDMEHKLETDFDIAERDYERERFPEAYHRYQRILDKRPDYMREGITAASRADQVELEMLAQEHKSNGRFRSALYSYEILLRRYHDTHRAFREQAWRDEIDALKQRDKEQRIEDERLRTLQGYFDESTKQLQGNHKGEVIDALQDAEKYIRGLQRAERPPGRRLSPLVATGLTAVVLLLVALVFSAWLLTQNPGIVAESGNTATSTMTSAPTSRPTETAAPEQTVAPTATTEAVAIRPTNSPPSTASVMPEPTATPTATIAPTSLPSPTEVDVATATPTPTPTLYPVTVIIPSNVRPGPGRNSNPATALLEQPRGVIGYYVIPSTEEWGGEIWYLIVLADDTLRWIGSTLVSNEQEVRTQVPRVTLTPAANQ